LPPESLGGPTCPGEFEQIRDCAPAVRFNIVRQTEDTYKQANDIIVTKDVYFNQIKIRLSITQFFSF